MVQISVVMPTYQDSDAAVATATLVRPQLQAGDELLIVDNGSGADHRHACDAFVQRHADAAVRLLLCEERGSYAARNAGAAQAQGDVLAFTDAGCVPSAGWLQAIRAHFAASPCSRVAGPILMTYKHSPPSLVELVDARTHLNQGRYVAEGWAATANTAIRRDVFVGLGGFDRRLQSGGDYEFGIRASAHGHGIEWCAAMAVEHEARHTLHELMKKRRRIRLGQVQIAGLRDFSDVRQRAAQSGPVELPSGAERTYPPMSQVHWMLARLACRLMHVYERHTAAAK